MSIGGIGIEKIKIKLTIFVCVWVSLFLQKPNSRMLGARIVVLRSYDVV